VEIKESLKIQAIKEIEDHHAELVELSLKLHNHPEISFQEINASKWLADYLEEKGFKLERECAGLPTAFRASCGQGKPVIAFLAEYDALPGLGHACGHNLIAAIAVGAGLGVKSAMADLGGTLMVIGTPGEELYGGKAIMVDRGAFAEVDVAMMVHPGVENVVAPQALACISLGVEFLGKAAHAAAHPERGINALEALISAFNNINSLRQHIREGSRIHGIITEGGQAANIVPDHAKATFLVRAKTIDYLEELKGRVLDCFVAASLASGARLEYRWGEVTYAPLESNPVLARLFSQNMGRLGRKLPDFRGGGSGSTDMGNVSQVVPSLQPFIAIAPTTISVHSPEFAAAAASEEGHRGLIDAAKAMALTAIDLLEPAAMSKVKGEFDKSRAERDSLPL
jgi:amidohydrolase